MKLLTVNGNKTLVNHLEIANTLWSRTKGLLGRREMAHDSGLWILRCNSVHTFFMKFAIDLIFVDQKMVVRKTVPHVAPGRIVWPVWSASSVIELNAGFLDLNPLRVGEKLHVDHTLS